MSTQQHDSSVRNPPDEQPPLVSKDVLGDPSGPKSFECKPVGPTIGYRDLEDYLSERSQPSVDTVQQDHHQDTD